MLRAVVCSTLLSVFFAESQSTSPKAANNTALQLSADPVRNLKDVTAIVPPEVFQRGVTKWRHHGYVRFGDDDIAPSFYTFDSSGNFLSKTIIRIPDALRIEIHDFDRGEDASIVFCALAFTAEGKRASFIGWVTPDGTQSRLVRTTPYMPFGISLAADGSVWTVGQTPALDKDGHSVGIDLRGGVLRHFDSSGNLIQSFFPPAQFLQSSPRLISGFLVAAADRLGWYSPASGKSVYVEMSFDGSDIRTYPGLSNDSSRVTALTITTSGDAFLTVNDAAAIYHFDRQRAEWVAVPTPQAAPSLQVLLGSENNDLIFQAADNLSRLVTLSGIP